jgi:hypothetical protein
LLIIGSLSMNLGPILQVAENPPAVTQPSNPSPAIDSPVSTATPNLVPSGVQTPATGQSPTNLDTPTITPNAPSNSGSSPVILLNKERLITSTLLQIKVTDSIAALQQAMSMADSAQAQTQNLGQQVNDNGTYTLLKITVPQSQANELVSRLSSLGTVTGKEVTNNDITTQFADKFSQYQTLVTQRATLQDSSQTAQLDQQIKTLENELHDWEQKAGEETIVLWLEK